MTNTVSFQSFVSSITDPWQQAKVLYRLDEILLLCLCAVISGCESFVDIVEYVEDTLGFLRKLSPFEHEIPSHDTLSERLL